LIRFLVGLLLGAIPAQDSCKRCEKVTRTFRVALQACDCPAEKVMAELIEALKKSEGIADVQRKESMLTLTGKDVWFNLSAILGHRAASQACVRLSIHARDFLVAVPGSECPECFTEIVGQVSRLKGFQGAWPAEKVQQGIRLRVGTIAISFSQETAFGEVEQRIAKSDAKKHARHGKSDYEFGSGEKTNSFAVDRGQSFALFLCAECRKTKVYDLLMRKKK